MRSCPPLMETERGIMRNGRGSCVKWLRVGGGKSEWRRRNFASVPGPWLACGFKMKHPFNHIICILQSRFKGLKSHSLPLLIFTKDYRHMLAKSRSPRWSSLVASPVATSVAVGKDNKLQLYLASLLLRKSRKSLFSNSNSAQNVSNSSSCLGLICHRPHQSHQSPPPPSGLPSTAHPGEPAKTTTKSEKCSLPLA